MKLLTVMGARPNFVKVAPLCQAFLSHATFESKLVHTGQHYDAQLSTIFFQQLNLPTPDYHLGINAGSPTRQTAAILDAFEPILLAEQPDWVVVVGDVTSTFACAVAASQLKIKIAHVEAGLRSGDWDMPEERNRRQTDGLSDLLFVTEQAGVENLRREGIPAQKTHFVGNVLIDSLIRFSAAGKYPEHGWPATTFAGNYWLMTMHRPANVDTETGLRRVLAMVAKAAERRPVVLPYTRARKAVSEKNGLLEHLIMMPNVRILAPQGYLEFLNLMEHAAAVITDSGGVQEETTYLNVPCLTFRTTTERPVTIELGTNQLLADLNPETVLQTLDAILDGRRKKGQIPPLWDGKTAGRIAEIMSRYA